jgi:Tol biopolymer transport system component
MKTTFTFFTILLAVFALNAQDCNNLWVQVSPDGNMLYFSSDRHGVGYEIYSSELDGISNLQRLTFLPGDNFEAAISPDGSKVVFQNGAYGSAAEIYMMDNDGSNLTQLTSNNVYDGSPSFSPDGETIIFSAWDDTPYPEIFTMNIDGSNRTQITNVGGAYWQSDGLFSPAGNKIYFLAGYNADNHIVMMDLDGSNWMDITPPNSFGISEGHMDFNSDGSKIIFYTSENQGYNNGGDLVIANADGSNWNFLTNSTNGEYHYLAVFHPNDSDIFFTTYNANDGHQLFRMDTNGENVVAISNCSPLNISEERESAQFELYPNPASDELILRLGENNPALMQVFNTVGKLVYEQVIPRTGGLVRIDVADWPAGIYLVKIRGRNSEGIQKLIVAR